MRRHLGETRSSIQRNHALVSPDSFERTTLPHWRNTEIIVVIAPQMGAGFTQYFATLSTQSVGDMPYVKAIERFIFILEGELTLTIEDQPRVLSNEGYAYIPAGTPHTIKTNTSARISVLERQYTPLPNLTDTPPFIIGSTQGIDSVAMNGDEDIQLKKLIPQDDIYDLQINTMDFSPGASLPYVETHFMEHGLLMLAGGGIYRLDDRWYPVEKHDVIWMGPYSAQWFGAIGKTNARYLIYKSWNRDPLDYGQ